MAARRTNWHPYVHNCFSYKEWFHKIRLFLFKSETLFYRQWRRLSFWRIVPCTQASQKTYLHWLFIQEFLNWNNRIFHFVNRNKGHEPNESVLFRQDKKHKFWVDIYKIILFDSLSSIGLLWLLANGFAFCVSS